METQSGQAGTIPSTQGGHLVSHFPAHEGSRRLSRALDRLGRNRGPRSRTGREGPSRGPGRVSLQGGEDVVRHFCQLKIAPSHIK